IVVLHGGTEYLGTFGLNNTVFVSRRIWNNGTEPVRIDNITVGGTYELASVPSLPTPPTYLYLYPGRYLTVDVQLKTSVAQETSFQITVTSESATILSATFEYGVT